MQIQGPCSAPPVGPGNSARLAISVQVGSGRVGDHAGRTTMSGLSGTVDVRLSQGELAWRGQQPWQRQLLLTPAAGPRQTRIKPDRIALIAGTGQGARAYYLVHGSSASRAAPVQTGGPPGTRNVSQPPQRRHAVTDAFTVHPDERSQQSPGIRPERRSRSFPAAWCWSADCPCSAWLCAEALSACSVPNLVMALATTGVAPRRASPSTVLAAPKERSGRNSSFLTPSSPFRFLPLRRFSPSRPVAPSRALAELSRPPSTSTSGFGSSTFEPCRRRLPTGAFQGLSRQHRHSRASLSSA